MLQTAIDSGDKDKMAKEISNVNGKLREFTQLFEKRRMAIAGLGVE